MKVIIGLGNPGIKYLNNRHNAGHMVIDAIKVGPSKSASKGPTFKVLKSDKFMNDSGLFLKKVKEKYPKMSLSDLYIIHDDLDIPLGSFKIQFGKGPRVHNGLNDIYEKLGTDRFWHVRVGVDPTSRGAMRGKDLVLSDFSEDEKLILAGVIKQICNQLEE